jgi:hypothetical protein
MRLQERTWVLQRVAWCVMGLLVLAALAGLFATGPLSSTESRDQSDLVQVEYQRFQRHMAPSTLMIRLGPAVVSRDTVSLQFSESFVDAVQVQKIVPEPKEAKATPTGVEYTFAVADPAQSAKMRFFMRTEKIGIIAAQVGLRGREPARFRMFVYP